MLLPVTASLANGRGSAWPAERPIRLVVPVAPDDIQDFVARLLARALADSLGQTMPIVNMPGAGSNIAYEFVARARPDGYTLLAGSDSLSISPALHPGVGYDPVADFAPVARAVRVPQIMVVRADSEVRDLPALVAMARTQRVSVGTAGNGPLAHLLAEELQAATGRRWTHVPYRGDVPALNDLLAGAVQCVVIDVGPVAELLRDGRLRGLFVSTAERLAVIPDVPTLAEAGEPNLRPVARWQGVLAPAGTDAKIVARLNTEVRKAVRRPDVAVWLAELGIQPLDEPPEHMGAIIRADAERWAEVIRRADIRAD
jgi:tripartite-type tricarboxylate transporter receptor subunit TctC